SRWDTAHESLEQTEQLHNRLGIAMATRTYAAYRRLLESRRFRRLANFGALPQRLLWASTGTKDPEASDVLYVRALAAELTVNTRPEKPLPAFAAHGAARRFLSADGAAADEVIERFVDLDVDALAARLQTEAAEAFVRSWDELLGNIHQKSAALAA